MPRFRTIILVASLVLLLLGCLPGRTLARHDAQPCGHEVNALPASTPYTAFVPLMAKQATSVYITDTGVKYHRKGCRYLDHSRKRVSLSWAKSHHYKPCKVCKPPR